MGYVNPSGTIQLFRGINLDNRYMHTLYFPNTATQTTFFDGLVDPNLQFTNQSYTRVNRNSIKLKINSEQIQTCTYLRFNNRGNKWYYAFIIAIEYINENTTQIAYEIDVMQTWFFQGGDIQPCYVKREHVSDDTFKKHVEPEPVGSETYRLDDITPANAGSFEEYALVINSSNEVENSDDYMKHGIFCGTEFYSQTLSSHGLSAIKEHMGEVLGSWDKQEQSADIVDMYMFPSKYTGNPSVDYDSFSVSPKNEATNTYHPINNKLYTYPYCYLMATSKAGEACIYRWEYFDADMTAAGAHIDFKLDANDTGGGCIIVYPDVYNGVTDNTDAKLVLNNFPKCSWSFDAYEAWVAAGNQSKLNAEVELVNKRGVSAALRSSGDVMNTMGAVNNIMSLESVNPFTAASKSLSATAQAMNTHANINDRLIAQQEAANKINFEFKDALYEPDIVVGAQVPNIGVGKKYLGVYFFNCHVAPEDMVRIDNFFSTYGYAINDVKKPNISGRAFWNFVQTKGANIVGDMPASSKDAIARIFDGGIFFWNYARGNANIGNFRQSVNSRGQILNR